MALAGAARHRAFGVAPASVAALSALLAVIALAACDRPAPSPAAASGTPASAGGAAANVPVATMRELMEEVFEPTADRYW